MVKSPARRGGPGSPVLLAPMAQHWPPRRLRLVPGFSAFCISVWGGELMCGDAWVSPTLHAEALGQHTWIGL